MFAAKFFLLIVYACGLTYFCLSTLRDPAQRKKINGLFSWYCAIVLPLACIAGPFFHLFEPVASLTGKYLALFFWCSAIVALLWETRDVKDLEGGASLKNLFAALFLATFMFGPGLFLGAAWLAAIGLN
jgi:hypothetical protein